MLRRRIRAVLVALLLGVTGAWLWQRVIPDRAQSAAAAPAATARVQGDATVPRRDLGSVPADVTPQAQPTPTSRYVVAGSGKLAVVPGNSRVYGTGPLRRYMVEVESGIGEDGAAFAAFVERTLGDPRSWGHNGAMSLQRVDHGPVAFRVTLASPHTVDRYCAPLTTNGYTSCYDSRGRAMLNQARWETGVPWYANNLTTYREYMINHEVGHALGHGHVNCPRPWAPAPAMQQQTLGMQGCRPNAWPYP